jgi:TolA-binding protein
MWVASWFLTGCLLTFSEVRDIRREINEIKLDLGRLRTEQNQEFRKLELTLSQVGQSVDAQGEMMRTSTDNVLGQLADLEKKVRRVPPGAGDESGLGEAAVASPAGEGEDLTRSAQEQFAQGNYDEAIALHSKFLSEYPDSPRAPEMTFNLGRCYYEKKDSAKAREIFDRIVVRYPASNIVAESLHSRALCEINLSDTAAARATLEKTQLLYPEYKPQVINELLELVKSK